MKWLRAFASIFHRAPTPEHWARSLPPVGHTWATTPEEEFGEGKFRYVGRVGSIYADVGDTVTCENGHPIVHFKRAVKVGDFFDPGALTHWCQPEPEIGALDAPCVICGAPWFKGAYLHFSDGWRIST